MKQLAVKRTHILGGLSILDEAGKYNVRELVSEGFSDSFSVDVSPTFKHTLDNTDVISSERSKKVSTEYNLQTTQKISLTFPSFDVHRSEMKSRDRIIHSLNFEYLII